MLTYEQLKPALYKWGLYFRNKFNSRFEVHELVNEAWLANDLTKLSNIKYASNKIRYNMLSYIREECGGRVSKNKVKFKKPQLITNTMDNGEGYFEEDRVADLFNKAIDEYDDLELVDAKDEVDFAMQDCPWRQERVLTKYFLEQKGYPVITKEIGRSYGNISKLKKQGLEFCRERFCLAK